MLKPRGAICNLDCEYCYYLKKKALYPKSDFFMDDATLESFTRQYIEAQSIPEVIFSWQGGEPTLMGPDFFKRALYFQNEYRQTGMQIYNTLQTNGTLLDDEWRRFFRKNNFLIGISIDGPQDLHDAYRVDQGKRSTFNRVHIPVMSHTESGVCRTAKRGEALAKVIVHQVCDMERNPLSFLCESPSKLS